MREPCYIEPHVDNKSAAPWQVTKPHCLGQKESGFYVSKRLLWVLVEDVTTRTRMYIYIYVIIHTCKKRSASKVFPSITFSLAKVTLVAMLSTSNAYVGGRSCFRRAQGSRGHRELTLEQGDVVSWLQLKQGLGGQFSASFSTFSASNLMNFFLGRSLRLYSVVVLEVSISLWSCVGMWFVNRSHSCGNPRWREAGSLDYTCYCREEGDPADWDVTGLVVFRICLSFFSSFGKVLSDWHFY